MSGGPMVKRVTDVVLGAVLLVLLLPILGVCALGAGLALGASPFFTQDRVGRDGQLFRFIKVRTLPPGAPEYADKHQLSRLAVPKFCLALRALHLDELPQLLHVVTGRMSLVGPRPEMPNLHAQFDAPFATARTSVRPGCTGLWQISEYSLELISDHPEADLYYLHRQSTRLDLWILVHTIRLMIPGNRGGALVRLDDVPEWVIAPMAGRAPQGQRLHADAALEQADA